MVASPTTVLTARLPPDLHQEAATMAQAQGRSLTSWVVEAVAEKLARDKRLTRDVKAMRC